MISTTALFQFLWVPLAVWLPLLYSWALYMLCAVVYISAFFPEHFPKVSRVLKYKTLIWFTFLFKIAYAAFLTVGQYLYWLDAPFTRSFLRAPVDGALIPISMARYFSFILDTDFGYFLFYSWGRFWFGAILSIGAAFLFWWFLKTLKQHNERFFYEGEVELGFLVALLVGWPNVVVFVPLVFCGVVVISVIRSLLFRERFTTLGWPFVFAGFLALLWGSRLVELAGLAVLRV